MNCQRMKYMKWLILVFIILMVSIVQIWRNNNYEISHSSPVQFSEKVDNRKDVKSRFIRTKQTATEKENTSDEMESQYAQHNKNEEISFTETKHISDLRGKLQLTLNGVHLNLDSWNLRESVSAYLFDDDLMERAKVWKLMAELNDMIALYNNLTIKKIYDIQEVSGLIDDIVLDAQDVQALIEAYRKNPKLMLLENSERSYIRINEDNITPLKGQMWKGPKWEMPINYKFNGYNGELVKKALQIWEDQTCIQFEEKSDLDRGPHIVFNLNSKRSGCSSSVGKQPNGQNVELPPSQCNHVGTILHEIGHAIGFWHEHQRPDSGEYIRINYANIKDNDRHNFYIKIPQDVLSIGPYDYGSIMHYSITAFAKRKGLYTVIPTDMLYKGTIGQRLDLSFFDAKTANYVYCTDKCTGGLEWNKCKNGGYKNPKKCNECICPDGWASPYCESPKKRSQCGHATYTAKSSYLYMQFPNKKSKNVSQCSWIIKAPKNKRVSVTFLLSTVTGGCGMPCRDYVEIRYHDLEKPGPRFCCRDDNNKEFVSNNPSNQILINVRTNPGNSFAFFGGYRYK